MLLLLFIYILFWLGLFDIILYLIIFIILFSCRLSCFRLPSSSSNGGCYKGTHQLIVSHLRYSFLHLAEEGASVRRNQLKFTTSSSFFLKSLTEQTKEFQQSLHSSANYTFPIKIIASLMKRINDYIFQPFQKFNLI